MRKLLIASAAALPLLAGLGSNDAHAQAGAPWYGQQSFTQAVVVPGLAVAAVGGTLLHLLLNAKVTDGSLRAKANPVHEQFLANARQFQGVPKEQFVDVSRPNYNLAAVR